MITLDDFSFLIVTQTKEFDRLKLAYESIRRYYKNVEIVLVYENQKDIKLNPEDKNLIEVYTDNRVYVGPGYNLALKHATKKCFVQFHDDTFLSENFLENIIPHLSEKQFCNFVTVEPPVFNNPNTIEKPIKDFGRDHNNFNLDEFNSFCKEHIAKLPKLVVDSPYGGFFLVGYKSSMQSVGGFDETIVPYFHEDADLMLRLHQHGYRFVLVLNSIVYHMGSLTSRGTAESDYAHRTTQSIFLKKWKTSFEVLKEHTILNGLDYQEPKYSIIVTNPNKNIEEFLNLLHTPNSNIEIYVDGKTLNQQDINNLLLFPYIQKDLEYGEQYTIGNLIVKTKI